MITWAPLTWLTSIFAGNEWPTIEGGVDFIPGEVAVRLARAEIARGAGEFGGNNRGPDVDKYRGEAGKGKKGSWCASFQYWLESEARAEIGQGMPFPYTPGARKLFRLAVKHGQLVKSDNIRVGDLVLWARGPQGSWKAHIGRVSEVHQRGRWRYVAGNEGRYPAKVCEKWGHNRRRLIGFARMP